MSEPSTIPRPVRLVQTLPVLAALNLHGLTHARYWIAIPAALLLLLVVARGWRARYSERRVALAAIAGGAFGFVAALVSPPPEGPLPAGLLGPLCGATLFGAVLASAAAKRSYAWLFAWLLAILSMRVDPAPPGALFSLVLLALTSMAAAVLGQWDRLRSGAAGFVALALMVPLAAAATWGVDQGLWASQGTLIMLVGGSMERLVDGWRGTGEFRLPDSVYVGGRGFVPDSKRALFAVAGHVPAYLRGTVQDRFDGTMWTASRALEQARPDLASLGRPAHRATTQITFYSGMSTQLPSPAGVRATTGVGAQARGGWVLAPAGELRGLTVELSGDAAEMLPGEPGADPELVALPEELRAQLRPLADEIVRGAPTARERAQVVERYFRENFTYSLHADLIGKGHPLTVLVREKRPAYCVYFASAMAALLRSLGTPARLVGGFVIEGKNPITGSAVVRERDAHAWVEVFLEDEQRFATFDPTPWQSRDEALGLEQGIFGKLFEALGIELEGFWATLRRSPSEAIRRVFASPVLWGLLALVVAWRLLRGLSLSRARERRARAMAGADPRLRALYGRYLKLLKDRARIAPAPAETDDELLARLKQGRGEAAGGAAARFVGGYRLVRYRGADWTGALEASLEDLERALR